VPPIPTRLSLTLCHERGGGHGDGGGSRFGGRGGGGGCAHAWHVARHVSRASLSAHADAAFFLHQMGKSSMHSSGRGGGGGGVGGGAAASSHSPQVALQLRASQRAVPTAAWAEEEPYEYDEYESGSPSAQCAA